MSENTVLEGLALRRAVAEALGYEVVEYATLGVLVRVDGKWQPAPHVDTDLNTLKDAAAMLPDTHKLEVRWYPDETIAIVDVVGSIRWRVNRITVSHTEPATAAWNAVLRWKAARKQEAESVK